MTSEQVAEQLAPAELKELDVTNKWSMVNGQWSINDNGHKTGIDGNTLYLNFKDASSIKAGTPYIIRWASGTNVTGPVFNGVTVSSGSADGVKSADGTVTFQGTYSPTLLVKDDPANLFLGDGNKLYWPNVDGFYVNAFRAYFILSDDTSEPGVIRQFVLNFGEESTAISEIVNSKSVNSKSVNSKSVNSKSVNSNCYDLQGRRVASAEANASLFTLPSSLKPGLYILNGRKFIIR